MKKLFLSLFLTLALGVLLGAFCDVVNAHSGSDLDSLFQSIQYHDTDFDNYYSQLKNECQYYYTAEFTWRDIHAVQIFFSEYDGLSFSTYQMNYMNAYMSYGGDFMYLHNIESVPSGSKVYVISGFTNSSEHSVTRFSTTGDRKRWTNGFYGYTGYCYSFNREVLNGSGIYMENCPNPTFRYVKGEFNFFYNYSNHILEDNYDYFVEDDRLRIYTLETLNGKELNLNLSDFMGAYSAAASVNFTDITVILNCDNTDYTFQLSDQNSELYKVWEPYAEMFICKTLYSVFDVDQFSDVYLTAVSFNEVRSSAGGSFTQAHNIACNYVLKETSEPLEPEVVPDPDYNDTDVYTDQQIQDMKSDLHEKSSRFSFVSGDWIFVQEEDLPSFPGWATVYENYVWFADVNSDTTYAGHWWQMANNIPSVADLSRPFDPSEWFEQNKTFAFYDVILLKVWRCGVHVVAPSPPVISVDELAGYLVCISDRYYDHYNSELNLDLIKQLQLSAENSVLFYDALKTRLDDFAEDMDDGFNGFLDVNDGTQYQIINWLKTLDNDITGSLNNMQGVLTSGFSDVVSAINGIVIPSGGSSYSLPALSDELEYLFKPSLEWSAINYNDYVESLGVLALPFEFTFDVLDIAENQYDSDLKLHINQLSVDVPLEAGADPETTSFTVLSDQDIDFEPTSVVPAALWSTLQYLNAFGLVLVQALGTYNHIFRGGDK